MEQNYVAPELRVVEARVERGFSVSIEGKGEWD